MTLLADRYELAEWLGSGGMARVHAARDLRLGRRVAVKLVREDLVGDAATRARLLREARHAGAFHHPNAVAVFDVGTDRGAPFVVMELVEGETLADRLARHGRLEATESATIASAVLEALAAAHARGLVHRDVKPANVLLPHAGGVKLADFGIAKELTAGSASITSTGQILGTPAYLAPEQVAGEGTTPASDVYAVGVVLYECLAGRPPFTGEHAMAVALAHQREPVTPLLRVAPSAPAELAAFVEHALAKDPARRYHDAAAAREALAWAVGEPARTVPLRRDAGQEPTRVLERGATAAASEEPTLAPREHGTATQARAAAPTRALGGASAAPSGMPRRRGRRRWPLVLAALVLAAVAGWLALDVVTGLLEQDSAPEPEAPVEDPDDPGAQPGAQPGEDPDAPDAPDAEDPDEGPDEAPGDQPEEPTEDAPDEAPEGRGAPEDTDDAEDPGEPEAREGPEDADVGDDAPRGDDDAHASGLARDRP